MSDLRLVRGGAGDALRCHALYLAAVREGAAAQHSEAERLAWAPSETPEPWLAERLGAGVVWIAEESGVAVGFLVGGRREAGVAHLDLFFVRPDRRRTGVAPALYDAFAGWAVAEGRARLTADANHLLRPFLERRGWRALAEERVERGGVTLSRWTMEGAVPR